MAPEVVIKNPGHGKPADWWSLGIFSFDLLTGRSPFHSNQGKKETKERILRGKFHFPSFITGVAQDFIRSLLRRNVTRRLGSVNGAADVKRHAFFADIDFRLVEARAYEPPHIPEINARDLDTDISQFDPRFTSRTPRESETSKNPMDKAFASLFTDFDFVAVDALEPNRSKTGSTSSSNSSSTLSSSASSTTDVTSVKEFTSILDLKDLSIRCSGH